MRTVWRVFWGVFLAIGLFTAINLTALGLTRPPTWQHFEMGAGMVCSVWKDRSLACYYAPAPAPLPSGTRSAWRES